MTIKSISFSEGYAFHSGHWVMNNNIIGLFSQITGFGQFCELNKELNGMYSIYYTLNDQIYLYVSPGGFHKLYYTFKDSNYQVSAKSSNLAGPNINKNALFEYRSALYCWGDQTLYDNVYAVEPGIAVALTPTEIKKEKLFSYTIQPSEIFTQSYTELVKTGKSVFNKVIDRMVMFLENRQALIPLSGGYDSRFILSALVSKGYKNILAFTYGTPNTKERENAEKTAIKLGVQWIFIPYTESIANETVWKSNLDEYFNFMVNGNSFPSMHEIIALTYLKKSGLVKPGAVFIPGHSGDLLGGSQFIKVFPYDLDFNKIGKLLVKEKLSFFPHTKLIKHQISNHIENYIDTWYNDKMVPTSVFEDIDMREKLSKHILNASRIYAYFGYNYYFPFWDRELIDFFKYVPYPYKIEKKLYNDILEQILFNPFGIIYKKELHPSLHKIAFQKIKNRIKPFLPLYLKQKLKIKNDNILYSYLTRDWQNQMIHNGFITDKTDLNYNAIIAQWVIFHYFSKK
jgi:asparagine synthase (glutamine-hydrolysing)